MGTIPRLAASRLRKWAHSVRFGGMTERKSTLLQCLCPPVAGLLTAAPVGIGSWVLGTRAALHYPLKTSRPRRDASHPIEGEALLRLREKKRSTGHLHLVHTAHSCARRAQGACGMRTRWRDPRLRCPTPQARGHRSATAIQTLEAGQGDRNTMTPESVLSHPARVLSQRQRESYFSDGYVVVESLFGPAELADILAVVDQFLELSKRETRSGEVFDLAPGHSADSPRLRARRHTSIIPVLGNRHRRTADVQRSVGPDVVSSSKLFQMNTAMTGGLHQDIQFYAQQLQPVTIVCGYTMTLQRGARLCSGQPCRRAIRPVRRAGPMEGMPECT